MNRRIATALLVALAAACDKPLTAPGLDLLNCPSDGGDCSSGDLPGVISGSVVYTGTSRGDAVLLLFDQAHLPPPDGNATSAVALARVPAATLFANAQPGSIGPFSSPYVFTQVPAGRTYQIRAFIDAAGEFDPFFDFTQQPRAGDPVGGYGTIGADGQPRLLGVPVEAGKASSGINVALTRSLPFDPPSFVIKGAVPQIDQSIDRPVRLQLQTVNLGVQKATFTRAHFGVEFDRDATGANKHTFGDGLDDVFPKVVLRQLTSFDETGAEVPAADPALIPAQVNPVALLPLLAVRGADAGPLAADTLDVLIQPFAVRAANLEPLPLIPKGKYQIVVIEKSGQVWTMPNSLGDEKNVGTPFYSASQHAFIAVSDAKYLLLPDGSVSGKVVFQGDPSIVSGNILVQAYRDDPQNPPPPLGAAEPVRVQVIRASSVVGNPTGFSADFKLAGLPAPQHYIIQAIADVRGTIAPLNLLQTPVKGDLVGGILDKGNLASVLVDHGGITGQTVTLAQTIALDPRAFQLDDSAGAAIMTADAVGAVRFGVVAAPLQFPIANGAQPVFTVSLVRDAAGKTVDADGDGLPDVWPRAFLVRLDPNDPADLTTLRDPADQSKGLLQVIPAAVDPTAFLAQLKPAQARPAVTFTTNRLTIIARPAALDVTDRTRPPQRLGPGVPPGKYKVVLINQTGQAWQIPNEANPAALDPRAVCDAAASSCAPGTVRTQSQGRSFMVGPPVNPISSLAITGKLTVPAGAAVFGAYVYAFNAANPPPPAGTGTPVSADYHSGLELKSGSVNYVLPNLVAGQYVVTAVVDTRGDYAISPMLLAAAPGEGALVAGGVASITGSNATLNLTALAASALPPRPSFTVTVNGTPATGDLSSLFPDAVTPQRISLHAQSLSGLASPVAESAPAFPVSLECDSSGAPTNRYFANLPGLYPKIQVVKLADSDPSGLTLDPATTIIPAAVDPSPFLARLGTCASPGSIAATDLSILLSPAALQLSADKTVTQVPIPKGRYGIVLVSSSGQVWRLPNELQPGASSAPVLATQGVAIAVGAQVPAASGGAIRGAVRLNGFSASTVGNLVVSAYAASAPPPPYGLGRPLAAQVIPAPVVASLAGGGVVPYGISNLAPGNYLVVALLDRAFKFSPLLSYMATLPQGAQVAISAPIAVAGAVVSGKDVTISASGAAVPFERPAFALDPSSTLSVSSGAAPGTAAPISLVASRPAGLAYSASGAAFFHPTAASSTPDQSQSCGSSGAHPFPSTQVYVTPLDTGSRLVPLVQVNACQFCMALTGTSDCTGALLAPPNGPLPQASIAAAVTNLAVDPQTRALAGVPLPPGHYAITVVEATGQSWTLPNEIADATQSVMFTVAP